MRRTSGSPLALVATAMLFYYANAAQAQVLADAGPLQFTDEELENLLAPVALYPDPILAQVLVAASYPQEIDLAARHVSAYGESGIDDQPWDLSVKAVARYEPVLNLMADRLDWTTALGQAYAEQPDDVMAAVQSLRAMARAQGNLVSTDHHEVVVEDRYIRILPARPRVVYVPVYDPLVVYHRPIVHLGVYGRGWSFGIGFPIGVWLTYDLDWRRRHIYYHGWEPVYRRGWIRRSRPFIVVNNIYVRHRPRVVVVNRRVINRYVDYRRFSRYNTVHRRVGWDRHYRQATRRHANRTSSWRADDRGGRNPSWNRSGRTRAYDSDGRANDRAARAGRNPSWNRSGRTRAYDSDSRANDRAARAGRNPSWDRSGRMRASDSNGRRAVERSAPAARSRRSDPQRAAPRPQRRSSEPRAAQPRTQTRRVSAQPERARSTRSAVPRSQSVQRSRPQRAEPRQVRSNRAGARQQRQSSPSRASRSRARSVPSRARAAPSSKGQRSEGRASSRRSGRGSASKARSSGSSRGRSGESKGRSGGSRGRSGGRGRGSR